MQCNYKNKITHSIKVTTSDVFVSIGYISSFTGLCNARLHKILKGAECTYQGKRKLYPFGKTILYMMEYNSFKYSKYLTENGKKIKQLQGVIK